MAILTSEKLALRTSNITKDQEEPFIIINRSVNSEDIISVNCVYI